LAQPAKKKNLSTLKRVRQSEKRNLRNRTVASKVKTYVKKVTAALEAKDQEQAQAALRNATKVISSAASKGVLHKNTASRKISRLAKQINAAFKTEAA
jgi:small subunit ribosomal protein S20